MDNPQPALSFSWPPFPLPASLGASAVIILAIALLGAAFILDKQSGGLLTVSLLVLTAFVSLTFTLLLYPVQQSPMVDILVGCLATSVGAIVAFWMSGGKK